MPEIAIQKSRFSRYTWDDTRKYRNQEVMTEQTQNLLPRVATGDSVAVSECLDRYGSLVWSLAKRSLGDRQAAEDAVQEIFLKLWEVADRFDSAIANETTFIAMIARRKLIDMNRKRKLPTQTSVEFDGFSGSEFDAAQQLEISDEAAKAAGLLQDLPKDQQQVIKLSVYDGLSHSKIAEATGLSLGTVKTHIRRGILKLREALFPEQDYDGYREVGTLNGKGEN